MKIKKWLVSFAFFLLKKCGYGNLPSRYVCAFPTKSIELVRIQSERLITEKELIYLNTESELIAMQNAYEQIAQEILLRENRVRKSIIWEIEPDYDKRGKRIRGILFVGQIKRKNSGGK